MDNSSQISSVVLEFLEDRKAALAERHKTLTDIRLDSVVSSIEILVTQARRWPQQFKDMGSDYQDTSTKLFELKSPEIRPPRSIPADFVEAMFDGLKRSDDKGRMEESIATAFGCGVNAFMYALLILTLLFAAHEAAERSGVDNLPVLKAVASFLAGLDFKASLVELAGGLAQEIAADLPSKLQTFA